MTQKSQHQAHLDSAVEQQTGLLNEVQDLNNQVAAKREIILKVQGVIEYLQQVVAAPEEQTTLPETKKGKS